MLPKPKIIIDNFVKTLFKDHFYGNTFTKIEENLDKITFTKTAMDAGKTVPKYKVTLGIMPSYADTKDGLHIDGVSENRPAANAGIKSGDILTKIGKCEVKEVYSYMDCLSKVNSGEELPVSVLRDGKEVVVMVKF